MNRKFYIITTLIDGIATAIAAKAVTSPSADAGATDTQIADIRTSGVQVFARTTPGIWLRRASARSAAAYLNAATGNEYSVKEVGEFKRVVRPVKGYKFERPSDNNDGFTSWYLEDWRGDASKAANKALVGDLIPTRALARAALPEQQAAYAGYYGNDSGKLRIVTVYADA